MLRQLFLQSYHMFHAMVCQLVVIDTGAEGLKKKKIKCNIGEESCKISFYK